MNGGTAWVSASRPTRRRRPRPPHHKCLHEIPVGGIATLGADHKPFPQQPIQIPVPEWSSDYFVRTQ